MKPLVFTLCVLTGIGRSTVAEAQINAYAQVTQIAGTTLTLSNVNQVYHTFAAGEQVLLIQMQDAVIGGDTANTASYGTIGSIANAGKYEAATIASVAGMPATLTLSAAPVNGYTLTANGHVQVVSFNTLSAGNYTLSSAVSAVAWNGSVGGIVAFQVGGTLTLASSVSADGAGFHGGALSSNYEVDCEPTVYDNTSSNYGYKGEGIYATPTISYTTHTGRGPLINGGGGGSDDNGGGGGGANYTTGGAGGPGWTCTAANQSGGLGGVALGSYISGGRMFMGGGGGSGQQNNSVGSPGAAGGGIVFIKANTLSTSCAGSVSISAAGLTAANSGNDGSGGGGAGGTVALDVNTYTVSGACPLTVAASGGGGGNVTDPNSHGGGGGGGQGAVIYTSSLPTSNITTTVNNGAGGTNNASGTTSASGGGGTNNSGILPGTPIVLPVNFLAFTAQKSGQEAILNWVTSKTYQDVRFTIERSGDGQQFAAIATVDALSDGGSTESYVYTDAAPLAGTNYYRISEVDLDGGNYYTGVALVRWAAGAAFHLYPNPAHGSFNVLLAGSGDGPVSVVIEDMAGSVVYRQETVSAGGNVVVRMGSSLATGIYMIRVGTGEGVQTGKLMVR